MTRRLAATLLLAALPMPALADVPPERMLWWKTKDHVLDVAGMIPQETVHGVKAAPLRVGTPLPPDALLAFAQNTRTQSLLVWHGGTIRFEYYAAGTDATTRSAPASMMKPVLALATGVSVTNGQLSLDAPISRWLTEWRDDPRGTITLRQLLTMTSGLAKDGLTSEGGRGAELMLGTDIDGIALATPRAGPPGVVFDYNNVNSQLVRLILERATGRRYADWLSRGIWQPIGASDAAVWLDHDHGAARGYGGLIAVPRDWLRVGLLIKNDGRVAGRQVVAKSWIAAMTAPSPRNPNFGFNTWRASPFVPVRGYGSGKAPPVRTAAPFLAPDTIFFDGGGGQRVYVSRAADTVIVRIGATLMDWDDSRLPNLVAAAIAKR